MQIILPPIKITVLFFGGNFTFFKIPLRFRIAFFTTKKAKKP